MNLELKEFINFLRSTINILSFTSIFPLVNLFFRILYVPKGNKKEFYGLAWFSSIISIYFIFTFRHLINSFSDIPLIILVLMVLIFGFLCIVFYRGNTIKLKESVAKPLTDSQLAKDDSFFQFIQGKCFSRWNSFFLTLYIFIFVLNTVAFTTLATRQYSSKSKLDRNTLTDKEIILLVANSFDDSFFRIPMNEDSFASYNVNNKCKEAKRNIEKFFPFVKDHVIKGKIEGIIVKLDEILQLDLSSPDSIQNVNGTFKEIMGEVDNFCRSIGVNLFKVDTGVNRKSSSLKVPSLSPQSNRLKLPPE